MYICAYIAYIYIRSAHTCVIYYFPGGEYDNWKSKFLHTHILNMFHKPFCGLQLFLWLYLMEVLVSALYIFEPLEKNISSLLKLCRAEYILLEISLYQIWYVIGSKSSTNFKVSQEICNFYEVCVNLSCTRIAK